MSTHEIDEVRRVNRLVRQFEAVFKSTTDVAQRERVRVELKNLKDYREQYLSIHGLDARDVESTGSVSAMEDFPILRDLIRDQPDPPALNNEIAHLKLYMDFYYGEFVIFLTPKKLKLDVKSSLERDKLYPEYHELLRQVREYQSSAAETEGLSQTPNYRKEVAADLKSRTAKLRTNLLIRAARYFLRVRNFSQELLDDLQDGGGICKNGDEILGFEELDGVKYLDGLSVWHALQLLQALTRETVLFLNVPEASLQ